MSSEEPALEPDTLGERVRRLEERMTPFEQRMRSFPEPAEVEATEANAVTPDTSNDTAQEPDQHDTTPEGT
jgi:hypothetical protein